MKLNRARGEVEESWRGLLKLPVNVETDRCRIIFYDNGEALTDHHLEALRIASAASKDEVRLHSLYPAAGGF